MIASLINGLQAVLYIAGQELELDYYDFVKYWSNYGAYATLGFLVAAHVTYFIFENFVFEKSLRYATVILAKLFIAFLISDGF